MVGLKDVAVVAYERHGPNVELMVEQVPGVVACPTCGERAQVKERPVVHYVDLPVYGVAMSLAWKKHRMRWHKCRLRPPELGPVRPPDRGEELPAHNEGRQVGHGAGRHGQDRV